MNNLEELVESTWFKERPEHVKLAILEYPPTHKYKLTTTGQIVRMYSWTETEKDGKMVCEKCQILVLEEDNPGRSDINRRVFGIPLEELEQLDEIDEINLLQ